VQATIVLYTSANGVTLPTNLMIKIIVVVLVALRSAVGRPEPAKAR